MSQCRGKTKAGKPCRASAWENGYCIAHQEEKVKAAVGHASGTRAGGGRKDPLKVPVLAKQIVEANALAILYPYLRALGLVAKRHKATGQVVFVPRPELRAKLYGTSKDGIVRMSSYEDLEAMMRAAERLMDRIYGKPKQALELAGSEDGNAVRVEVASNKDRAAEVAQILAMTGAVRSPSSGNGHG